MAYVPKPETASWEAPPPFAPWRELSDEEFERLEAEYDAQFEEKGAMRRWYDHVADAPKKKTARAAGGD